LEFIYGMSAETHSNFDFNIAKQSPAHDFNESGPLKREWVFRFDLNQNPQS